MNRYNKLDQKLRYLNLKVDSYIFNVFRIITCTIFFFLIFISLEYGYIVAPILVVIYYYLFEYIIIDLNVDKKNNILLLDALDYFPNFLLIFKNNKNVVETMKLTNKTISNSITRLFEKVLDDVRIGKTLEESLNNLLNIIPNDIIANIIINLIEANKNGNDVTDGVNKQLTLINLEKKKITDAYYKSIPFKIGISSLVFSFLMIFVLIILKIIL